MTQLPKAWGLGEQHVPGAGSAAGQISCHSSHSLGRCHCFQVEWKPRGPGRVMVPLAPWDFFMAFLQASVGAWFPRKPLCTGRINHAVG